MHSNSMHNFQVKLRIDDVEDGTTDNAPISQHVEPIFQKSQTLSPQSESSYLEAQEPRGRSRAKLFVIACFITVIGMTLWIFLPFEIGKGKTLTNVAVAKDGLVTFAISTLRVKKLTIGVVSSIALLVVSVALWMYWKSYEIQRIVRKETGHLTLKRLAIGSACLTILVAILAIAQHNKGSSADFKDKRGQFETVEKAIEEAEKITGVTNTLETVITNTESRIESLHSTQQQEESLSDASVHDKEVHCLYRKILGLAHRAFYASFDIQKGHSTAKVYLDENSAINLPELPNSPSIEQVYIALCGKFKGEEPFFIYPKSAKSFGLSAVITEDFEFTRIKLDSVENIKRSLSEISADPGEQVQVANSIIKSFRSILLRKPKNENAKPEVLYSESVKDNVGKSFEEAVNLVHQVLNDPVKAGSGIKVKLHGPSNEILEYEMPVNSTTGDLYKKYNLEHSNRAFCIIDPVGWNNFLKDGDSLYLRDFGSKDRPVVNSSEEHAAKLCTFYLHKVFDQLIDKEVTE